MIYITCAKKFFLPFHLMYKTVPWKNDNCNLYTCMCTYNTDREFGSRRGAIPIILYRINRVRGDAFLRTRRIGAAVTAAGRIYTYRDVDLTRRTVRRRQ